MLHYETILFCKTNHPPLDSDKSGSSERLTNLLKSSNHTYQFDTCDNIIKNQEEAGKVQKIDKNLNVKIKSSLCCKRQLLGKLHKLPKYAMLDKH